MKELTYPQAHVIASALGINLYKTKNSRYKSSKSLPESFRQNKFVADPDQADWKALTELVSLGLMEYLDKPNYWFVTDKGRRTFRQNFMVLAKSTRPILFSAPMVRAILAGTKTQTRRVIEDCRTLNHPNATFSSFTSEADYSKYIAHFRNKGASTCFAGYKPRYLVGDVLYVRETWGWTTNINRMPDWPNRPHLASDDKDAVIIYAADGHWQWLDEDGAMTDRSFWKPSIFMPKDAARIFLKVTDVRVERLQAISEEDALNEGVERCTASMIDTKQDVLRFQDYTARYDLDHPNHRWLFTAKDSFRSLWQNINGQKSWEINPFVWVYEFERIEKTWP